MRTTSRNQQGRRLSTRCHPTQLDAASQVRSIANAVVRKAQLELRPYKEQHQKVTQTLRSLAKDQSVIITRPDKGRGVVLMDRTEYNLKMESILRDESTFKALDHDPTILSENRLIRTLLRLQKRSFITRDKCNMARQVGSRAARLYGLPKLHKPDAPLRPVMSATKTVGHGLGKMLTYRLSELRQSPHAIKDSFDFVKKVRGSTNTDKMMVSFDVTSLFTNVPLTYTIDYILNKMHPASRNN
jgi:hypothetical protein